jgi:hypothetical protein
MDGFEAGAGNKARHQTGSTDGSELLEPRYSYAAALLP